MSSNTGGVSQSIKGGSNTGAMQAGVAGGNANVLAGDGNEIQQTNQVAPAEKEITQDEAIALLEQIEALLQTADLPDEKKKKANNLLAVVKDEAKEVNPDKDSIKTNLKKVAESIKTTSETVEATQGLWKTFTPIFVKLAPWIGVAASFFLGSV
ncbi:hypothetical protein PN499_17735 [Kamptonema animale CS-326]|jgi:ElaB/YqjD/DUF883 family membrane-anchored ribosome-binding protein|uniref:hypothetical protein n=1 Tax=Kamptonema animale TaxID=92934 RepID=UPI00232E1F53|nr:hypothetical protein [Kamptonema animale]MDB9513035.1 hypothetical protein [Kamptonema animale CS-326]